MILRTPNYNDCEFISECYENWVETDKGRVFPVDVRNWIKHWRKTSNIEQGLIGELDGSPVGVVIFSKAESTSTIYEIVVKRLGVGHGKGMWLALRDRLVSEGVVVADFEALPGVIADKTLRGDFEKIGESIGSKTGLPLVKGRVTADMRI